MATIFGSGQMENIPIGIVDQDNTATSRQIARNISAVPTFSVTRHFTDEAAARQAVQRKEIYGYLSIPTGFEQHATTGMDATLSYYYHYALLSVGSELMAAFETALAPVALSPIAMEAISLGLNQEQITTFLLPVQASMHPLYNPDLDYSVYLSQPFFYVLFQILILLMTVYAIGSEIKFNTAQEWLTTARGNILTAVTGKLLPYTFIFSVIGILANYILYGVVHIPFHGSLLMMNLMTLIFIIATQALAVFIFSIFPRIAYIISIVSMIGSLGATLSGVTFPVTSMYPPVHAASYLFPVRHFTEISQSMIYFDSGFGYYWQSAAILLLFPLLALLILPRLRHWILKDTVEEDSAPIHSTAYSTSIATIIFREWRAISTNAAILLVLIGGIFAYGLLYNLMYAPNLVRKTPVAVVDNSHSALSREYIRLLNATPQASVYALTPNYLEAKEWLKQSKVDGILYLPADFDTRVGRGEQSVFSVYAATDAFLNFKNLQEASSRVMLAVNDAHRAEGAVFLPPQGLLAVASSAPVNVAGTALYNYTEGYGSYLIPAVMIIIIFQTLLMVIGMVTGEEAERKRLPTTSPYGYLPPLNSPVNRGKTTSPEEENVRYSDKRVYILRPCMIHGPGNKGNLNLLYNVVKKGIPWPLGDFENKRSFTSIDNLCYVVEGLLTKDVASGIYHMGDDEALSTNELIALMCEAMGKEPHIWKMNRKMMEGCAGLGTLLHLPLNTERLRKLTENYVVSNEKIKSALGIDRMPVRAADGIMKTIRSF